MKRVAKKNAMGGGWSKKKIAIIHQLYQKNQIN